VTVHRLPSVDSQQGTDSRICAAAWLAERATAQVASSKDQRDDGFASARDADLGEDVAEVLELVQAASVHCAPMIMKCICLTGSGVGQQRARRLLLQSH
jgi:hypothetical protein